MRRLVLLIAALAGGLWACGEPGLPSRPSLGRGALTNPPELLELEPLAARQELFREVVRASQSEAAQVAGKPVLFPVSRGGEWMGAPALEGRSDLLQPLDAGEPFLLTFSSRPEDRWPEDRRDALQGLSEKEAAELVARSLLARWNLSPKGAVEVDRAPGAPYAAAYVDHILRINPSFLYLATSVGSSSGPGAIQ